MRESSYCLKSLNTGYCVNGKQSIVGKDLNANLYSNSITCLIGPNGAGKSTLLRTLANFQPPLGGSITLQGQPLSLYTQADIAKLVSIVLTNNSHIRNLSVYDVVGMGRSPYTGFWGSLNDNDKEIVDHCLESVGVENLKDRQINTLSDGERQKVMIAKAIAQETPIILLDEPTSFLYYTDKVQIMLMLKNLAHEMNKTILLSTHAIDIALQTADYLWSMKNGELITGSPEELCKEKINSLSYENILECINIIDQKHKDN